MAPNMVIQNMSFRLGQSMAIVGTVKPNAAKDTIVCNSQQQGRWQQEVRPGGFCFLRGENFKIIIKLTSTGFVVTLPNGSQICFPNRFYSDKYSYFSFNGDVRIKSFEIY
ncbi:galectin-2 isoform X2 [Oryzias latipes]